VVLGALPAHARRDRRVLRAGRDGIRCQKSTQAGWSETLATLLGYIIDVMPAPIIVLFPKEKKAKEFNLERFEPMVNATPRLAAKVPLKSREKGITQTFKLFPGGWLKFVHSHSADEVKSSSARYGVRRGARRVRARRARPGQHGEAAARAAEDLLRLVLDHGRLAHARGALGDHGRDEARTSASGSPPCHHCKAWWRSTARPGTS
jgi:hypothetical protein